MGVAGVATRILGPARGSFLTYGALDEHSGTAPGQITASDLKELYRCDELKPETMITGIVGLPVAHSLSPQMHNAAFAASKIDAVYLPLAVRDVQQFVRRMVHPGIRDIRLERLSGCHRESDCFEK